MRLTLHNMLMIVSPLHNQSQRDLQLTHSFNSIVLDLCDALWRNRAFSNDSRPYPTLLFHLSRFAVHVLQVASSEPT